MKLNLRGMIDLPCAVSGRDSDQVPYSFFAAQWSSFGCQLLNSPTNIGALMQEPENVRCDHRSESKIAWEQHLQCYSIIWKVRWLCSFKDCSHLASFPRQWELHRICNFLTIKLLHPRIVIPAGLLMLRYEQMQRSFLIDPKVRH